MSIVDEIVDDIVTANCRSEFSLDRLGTCLKLFVSTQSSSSHEFASQFGLAIFIYAKNTKTIANTESPRDCLFE